jgi:hypothetical protein
LPRVAPTDIDRLLEMLRDPNVESREVAAAAGVPREEAARAARLVHGIAKAPPEEIATLAAPLALAACRAALAAGRPDVVAALAAHPGKEVAKEAKRALHILKSRGVAVPEPPRPTAPAAAAAPEPPLAAYATAVDARGERAAWIPRNVPGKGIEVAQAVLSDELGIVQLQVGVVGRKEWRAIAKGLVERGTAMGLTEVDRERATALVVAARPLNDRSGHPVPERADLWLAQAGPAAPPPDPAASFPPLPPGEEEDALAASGKLHDLALLETWLADEGFLREVAAKLDEIAVSPLYVDERQRAAQMAHTVSDAVERYFDERRRAALSRRLFSIAEHLGSRGDPAHAQAAAAAARALRGDVPARSIPFARLLVEKAFPPAAPADDRPTEPPTGPEPLIVAPR